MLDTLKIFNELKEKLEPDVALKLAETFGVIYGELANTVTKTDFNELKTAVGELAEAQKRTEQRLDSLTVKVEELAEAQKRTEQRIEELAEAQKRTEQRLDSLTVKVEELAEAQKRTEQRLGSLAVKVEELAEAQKRTEQRVEELAEAQKRTEERLDRLDKRVDNLQKEVGGISNALGYSLENSSYKALTKILPEKFGIKVEKLYRKNLVYPSGKFDEINIFGEGLKGRHKIYVIGESKSQFGLKDVKQFLKLLERVKNHLQADIFPLALAHQFHPRAEAYLKEKGIAYFWSYEVSE